MPINVWSAGQDALLSTIARRDAERRLEEDRARRDRLDTEAFADRQRQREIQEAGIRSLDEDRDERRKLATEERGEKAAKAKREALNAAQIGELLDAYDAATTPEEKHAVGIKILNAGGKYTPPPRAAAPQRPISVSPGATLLDPVTKKPFYTAPERPEKPSARSKDDPNLPQGTKAWIESISQRGVPIEQARAELSQGWAQQRAAHPNADLAAAASYLMKLYPADTGSSGTPRVPLGTAPAPETPQAAAPPPAPGGGESAQQQLLNDAHAVISNHLGRSATQEEVAKFLSDPNNVAQLTKR